MKTSEKANMHNRAGLPPPHPLALCTLETQEGTMKDVCQLPYVSTSVAIVGVRLRELLARGHA